MQKCEQCAYWIEKWPIETRFSITRNPMGTDRAGVCSRVSGDYSTSRIAMAISDAEGIRGELLTKPDFGCIEWTTAQTSIPRNYTDITQT